MEDGKLKRRLIGAAVLILLAVIFIPKLLEKNDPFPISGKDIPANAETEFTSKITPLDSPLPNNASLPSAAHSPEPPAVETETTADSMQIPEPVTTESVPENAAAEATEPALSPEPVAESTAPAPEAVTGWVVQVGSFRSEKNAFTLRDLLIDKGYQAFIDESTDANEKSLRVRIGPETERPAANALRDKLEQEMKLKGLVKPYSS